MLSKEDFILIKEALECYELVTLFISNEIQSYGNKEEENLTQEELETLKNTQKKLTHIVNLRGRIK